jgi:DNA-binding beta-propeller fold protein YncE
MSIAWEEMVLMRIRTQLSVETVLAMLCALGAALAFASAPASAGVAHQYLSQLTGFENPTGVAVDSNGDVYVADRGSNIVYRFSSSGTPLDFSASEPYIEGSKLTGTPSGPFEGVKDVAVNNITGEVYVSDNSSKNAVDVFSESGEYLSQLGGPPASGTTIGPFEGPSGLTVNQSTGELYVVDQYNEIVDKFSAAGEYLSQIGHGTINGSTESVAVNELTGTTYVYFGGNNLALFSSTGSFLPPLWNGAATPKGTFRVSNTSVALDQPSGHLYVANQRSEVVDEFGASSTEEYVGELTGTPSGPFTEPQALAVDPSSGDVYVANRNGVVDVFGPDITVPTVSTGEISNIQQEGSLRLNGTVNPSGVQVSECYFEYGTETSYGHTAPCASNPGSGTGSVAVYADIAGLTPLTTYHYRIVAGNTGGTADGPDKTFVAPAVPEVSGESVSGIESTAATVSADVNPGASNATYRVEYGTSTAYDSTTASANAGDGEFAVGTLTRLGGLQPQTTYHLRVLATNALGTTTGGDVTFTTLTGLAPAGSTLPDERGYEMVSPLANADGNVYEPTVLEGNADGGYGDRTLGLPLQAAADGEAVAYVADPPAVGGNGQSGFDSGNEYLATRAQGGGWTATDVQPAAVESVRYQAFSSNLSIGILSSSNALVSGVPNEYNVLYSRTSEGGAYQPFFTTTPPNRSPSEFAAYHVNQASNNRRELAYAGASSNFEHVLFEANDALTENAVDGGERENNLYDSVDGKLHLVNILPGEPGQAAPNAIFGGPPLEEPEQSPPDFSHVISSDGSRIFWTDLSTGELYVRENGTTTVEVDASQGGTGSSGGGQFWTASSDGSKVFFTDCRRLTSDSTAVSSGGCEVTEGRKSRILTLTGEDLYEYDVNTGKLTDLTVDSNGSDKFGADVQGVVGASEDGSYVYFAAGGVLAQGATPKNCSLEESPGESPAAGCNLYVLHEGEPPKYIATLAPEDMNGGYLAYREHGDLQPGLGRRTAEVTPDGRHMVFSSRLSLTGYPNDEQEEVFLYDADRGHLSCVSCDPSGAPPAGLGAQLPPSESNTYMQRWVSNEGTRVFFDSYQALVPQDTNEHLDVYEWEQDGTGSCRQAEGCIYLLSEGTSTDNSYFLDASTNGDDVFIVTRAHLLPQDQNDNFNLYDARVGATQALVENECSGTGCQGSPFAPPIFATPSSVTFSGVGNFEASANAPAKPKSKSLTRAQKLIGALKVCKKKQRRRRVSCEALARKRYGEKSKAESAKGRK